jgi:carboxylate-amine ligase
MRYGHDAEFVARDGEETVSLASVVDRECARLGVDGIRRVLDAESGATAQRRTHGEEGPDALRESLIL